MAVERRRYSAELRAKVAHEALKGNLTVAELVANHGVRQTLIHTWNQQARSPCPRQAGARHSSSCGY